MEAFSLLKYWRTNAVPEGGGGGRGGGGKGKGGDAVSKPEATTILTAVAENAVETDDEDGDDGPFFDLEFTVPDEDDDEEEDSEDEGKDRDESGAQEQSIDKNDGGEEEEGDNDEDVESDCERELNFTLSSASSNDRADPNISLSPSDDLFFKGKLVPLESSEPNSKPQFPVSLLKSATKFRVFMSGLKRSSKTNTTTAEKTTEPNPGATKQKQEAHGEKETKQTHSKFFTVKFKVEDAPIVSLFTRDSSSRNGHRSQKQNVDESAANSDEKRFSKEVMQKYLKKMKPLYVRVSRRYAEKLRFSGQLSLGSGAKATTQQPAGAAVKGQNEGDTVVTVTETKIQKQGNLPARLRVVCKHLGKSRSASSVVAAAPAPAPAPASVPVSSSRRRDDSLLQQQDGIQSAILHCKRSFNASRDSESGTLGRCVSAPSHEVSLKSSDGGKKGDGL